MPRKPIATVGDQVDYLLRLEHWGKHDQIYTRREILFAVDIDVMLTQPGLDYARRQYVAAALLQIVTARKARKAVGQRAIFFLHNYIIGDQGSRRVSDLVQGCLWLRRTGMSRTKIFSVLTLLIETV